MKEFLVKTRSRFEMVDITEMVKSAAADASLQDGICHIFIPHTTAAVTINENADPAVPEDILNELDKVVPFEHNYAHSEGNSAAHIKASIIGASEMVLVENGKLCLGRWQSIFFCEFDGPRTRKFWVKTIKHF
ncbi:MAG: secondary thiamine-phosphate synthase enzyme YjbQ [Syntrophales bacterium]|nr:secondary thiamine-phosphate synthase enzyme YjbQ [Syntrophales bacterium]MDY0045156.1 secondary thiamine-phosphate synthase enzyme YjbQ [Syntrophales bacterium]